MSHVQTARRYMRDVLAGRRPACRWVQRACERQARDLERKRFPFRFDAERAERVCRFIELLPHIKGRWAGSPMRLEPWQSFLLTTVFGWVDRKGRRRFKTAYVEVPRKNGKSQLSAGIGLYLLAADGEPGAEVYSAATTRDQAKIVWETAKRMVERTPGLRRRFGVETSAHSIHVLETASWFRALSRDQGGNLDGLNVHGAIIDELHAHKTRDVWDVIETATGAREQPLIWAITTAGFNRAGICFEQRDYVCKLLDGVHRDEETFGVVYTIDDGDDWADEAAWIKANPNWGASVIPDDIRRKARKAMEMASAQNNFLTKHLNVWVNADTAWMDMRAWQRCADPGLDLDDCEGLPCWIGLDLASKVDVACMAILFRAKDHWRLFVRHYLPEDVAEEGRNAHYAGWAREGRITLTPGNVTDYGYIEDDLRAIAARFQVQEVAFDPWQAAYLANRLMQDGLPMVELRQTVQTMSPAMKELEALVLEGRLRHDADPVMEWMMANVVAHLDAKDNIYPRKSLPEQKIDGVVATIMALSRALAAQERKPSVYEERGAVVL